MKIFLDMDGVLTDFIGSAARVWGYSFEELIRVWVPESWDVETNLNILLTRDGQRPIDSKTFWGSLEHNDAFWEGMPKLAWADDVLELVSNVDPDFFFLSSPSMCPSSHVGKVKWLKRMFGPTFTRYHLTQHKHHFSHYPDAILIDDSDANCRKFTEHGGRAILFPAMWNPLHEHRLDPVPHVRKRLEELL